MELNQIILFSVIVMGSYFIEGLIGFGGTIIALPLASAVIGLKLTVPTMTIIVLVSSLFIAIRDYKYINFKQYFKISFFMVLGLPIGIILFKFLPERPLRVLLGIFMLIVAIKGLHEVFIKDKNKEKIDITINPSEFIEKGKSKFTIFLENSTLFLGGIIHGAFTCGGPFVVVYATNNIKDKSRFRATLCALWATLNVIMLSINIFNGEITGQIMTISTISMLFVIIAIIVSNIVHKKINGESFNKFVYIALSISGVLMMA